MIKKVFVFFGLCVIAGFYAISANAKGDGSAPTQTPVAIPAPSPTEALAICEVNTGIDGGTVNLRACEGTACSVLAIVTEGERLDILTAGSWAQVTNSDGVTGWLNSKFCKGK